MKLRIRKQWVFAGAAAAVLAAPAWFAPHRADDLATSATRAETPKVSPQSRETSQFATLPGRAALGEQQAELFGSKAWTPPASAVRAVPSAPAVPVMPPNPYKVAGILIHDGTKRVFLQKGERIYEATQGDGLDDGYRVDAIAADHVVLLYLPLGKTDQLQITSTFGADVTHTSLASARSAQTAIASAPRAAAIISAGTAEEAKPAQLRWEGPQSVRAGASFTVALRVSSSQQLRATPMMLRYEPKLLEPLEVRAGKFFGDGKFSYRVNGDGSIFVGATGQGIAPGADAELVVVTFKPIKPGATAEVSLSSLALQGAAGRALAYNQLSRFRTAIE